jgi:hypothetical protein
MCYARPDLRRARVVPAPFIGGMIPPSLIIAALMWGGTYFVIVDTIGSKRFSPMPM